MSLRIVCDCDTMSNTLSDIHEFIMWHEDNKVNCDCGSIISPSGVAKHINTKKHREHLLSHYDVPLDIAMRVSMKKEKKQKEKIVDNKPKNINFNIFEDKLNADIHTYITTRIDDYRFSCDCGGCFKASGFKKHVESKIHLEHFRTYYKVDPVLRNLYDEDDIIDGMGFVSDELAMAHKNLFYTHIHTGYSLMCKCDCGVEVRVNKLKAHFNSKKHLKMIKDKGLYFGDRIEFQ